jgi:biopolymer transport protein ExbB/TolQ
MESVLTWYRSGGPLMLPLLIVGLLGVALLAARVRHVLQRSRVMPRPFMERVISLAKGGRVDEALALCAEHHAALPDLGLVLLRSRSSDEAELRAIANASTLTVVPPLTRGLRWLPMLAQLALLLGVLGAVMNLHDALGDGATSVVEAVRYAARPLGAAVLTCLPLVVGHSYLQHQVQGTLEHMEEFSARIINALLGRPDVRLGHRN